MLSIEISLMELFLYKKTLFHIAEELFTVVELVSVKDTSSTGFACYGRKIKILEYCRLYGMET